MFSRKPCQASLTPIWKVFEGAFWQGQIRLLKLTDELTMDVHHRGTYGSELIKKAGVSSDAYVQMTIQLAVYRIFGKIVATRERTQIRSFLNGRTAKLPVPFACAAALAFCKAMGKEHRKDRSPETHQEFSSCYSKLLFVMSNTARSPPWARVMTVTSSACPK
jgi:hypothetical protein